MMRRIPAEDTAGRKEEEEMRRGENIVNVRDVCIRV